MWNYGSPVELLDRDRVGDGGLELGEAAVRTQVELGGGDLVKEWTEHDDDAEADVVVDDHVEVLGRRARDRQGLLGIGGERLPCPQDEAEAAVQLGDLDQDLEPRRHRDNYGATNRIKNDKMTWIFKKRCDIPT